MRPGGEMGGSRPPVGMAIKMLISPKEGACVLGPSGASSKQITDLTGARLHLSSKGEYYPGTQMQELCLKGSTPDVVVQGVMQVISKLAEETGRIHGGEAEVEENGARVHFVVPVPPETRSPMSGMGFWDSAGKVLFCGRLKMWNLSRGIWLFVYHSCGPS
ncbi:unnamed protein product [Effrenium voratum]|nr:unnamed protein product [Effrenium voratum]